MIERKWIGQITLMGFAGASDKSNRRIVFDLDSMREVAIMNYHMGSWSQQDEQDFNLLIAAPKMRELLAEASQRIAEYNSRICLEPDELADRIDKLLTKTGAQ